MPDAQGREQPGGRGQANSEDLLLMMILMVVLPMVTLMLLLLLLTRLISRMPAWQRDFRKIHRDQRALDVGESEKEEGR